MLGVYLVVKVQWYRALVALVGIARLPYGTSEADRVSI